MIEQIDNLLAPARPVAVRSATVEGKVGSRRHVVRRDSDAIVIDIPMTFRRRGKRKEIILPPDVVPAASPRPPSPLALAVARAFRWQEMIESGEAESVSDLARRLRLDPSYVARTIRLAALAPDIVEAILDDREPDGLSLRSLKKEIPLVWQEQSRLPSPGGRHEATAQREEA